jgi:hypothetical protein
VISLANPKEYHGFMGARGIEVNEDWQEVFMVNGRASVAFGNFIRDFKMHRVADHPIWVGGYPDCDSDWRQISQTGIKGVLSVQTSEEMKKRGVGREKVEEMVSRHGIKQLEHCQVQGETEDQLAQSIFQAS